MLPFLRTISVGGVLLAITILGLALTPPGTSHLRFAAADAPAGGALIDRSKHPEWRQFIILAALRRAGSIEALRKLPDMPVRLPEIPDVAPPYGPPVFPEMQSGETPRIAGLPAQSGDPDDETGSIGATPASIPIEIGEPSSTELPVGQNDERPPAIRLPLTEMPEPAPTSTAKMSATEKPEPFKPPVEPHKRAAPHHHIVPAKTAAPAPIPPPFNILRAIFESLLQKPPEAVQRAHNGKPHIAAKRTKVIRAVSQ